MDQFVSFFRDKLASMKLSRYKDDLLFYMFYNNVGDVLQIAAADELYVSNNKLKPKLER